MKHEFDIGTACGRLAIRAGNTHYDPKIGDPFASDIVTHYRRSLLDAHQRGRLEGMEEAAKVVEDYRYEHKSACNQFAQLIRAKAGEVKP